MTASHSSSSVLIESNRNMSEYEETANAVHDSEDDGQRRALQSVHHAAVAIICGRIEAPGAGVRSSWPCSAIGARRTLDGRGSMRRAQAR